MGLKLDYYYSGWGAIEVKIRPIMGLKSSTTNSKFKKCSG